MDQVNLRRETYNPEVTWLKNYLSVQHLKNEIAFSRHNKTAQRTPNISRAWEELCVAETVECNKQRFDNMIKCFICSIFRTMHEKWNLLFPSQQNSTTTTRNNIPEATWISYSYNPEPKMQTLKASGHMDQVNLRRETYNPAVTWLKNHTINGIGTRSHTIQRLQFSWRHYVRTDATTWIYCETVRSQRPVDPNGDWDKLLRSFKSNYTPVVKESRLQPS